VFAIREPLPPVYWVNVLDAGVSFRLLVNHTTLGDCPFSVVYCSSYVRPSNACLDEPADAVLDRYLADLHRVFGRVTVLDRVLSRSRNGTPVFDRHFRGKLDRLRAAVPGVSYAGNPMVFPGARTLSSVIGTGYRAADEAALGLTA
jgi:protoporphyrinogen oxidase